MAEGEKGENDERKLRKHEGGNEAAGHSGEKENSQRGREADEDKRKNGKENT